VETPPPLDGAGAEDAATDTGADAGAEPLDGVNEISPNAFTVSRLEAT
jgi:hypothetical protein